MKSFFIKLTLFVIIVWIILSALDYKYTSYYSSHLDVCRKASWILSHKDQVYDFAFLGNSRVDNMTDIAGIEKKTGKKGINIGFTGSNTSEMYLLLYEFLKNGNTVKNLLLEVDLMSLNSKKVDFKLHYPNYMYLFHDTVVNKVYEQNTEPYRFYLWNYIPFVRYMEYSNQFVLFKMVKGGFACHQNPELDSTRGTEFLTVQKMSKAFPKKYVPIEKSDSDYLNAIVALAKTNGINIIFYTAPLYTEYRNSIINYKDITEYIRNIAIKENIPYFDFATRDTDLSTEKDNYFDETHFKKNGAIIFSAQLSDSISPLLKN